jgi:hypothetical protein
VPDASGEEYLILLAERREPDPGLRLGQVANLRLHQFRKPLVLQDGPGGRPGKHPWRQDVQPDEVVIERQSYRDQEENIGDRDPSEYGDPVDRQRHGQPDVIKLVQPLFYPPDIRISGQVHRTALLSAK